MKRIAFLELVPPLGRTLSALLLLGLVFAAGGCDNSSGDDDDDATVTPTAVPDETPTPIATPTPEPFVLEDGTYYLEGPYYMDLSQDPQYNGGYPIVIWQGLTEIVNSEFTDGKQVWIAWASMTDLQEGTDNYCLMPEDFIATPTALTSPRGCVACQLAYDMTFYPIEEETTCPEDHVIYFNGPDPYAPWDDTWAFSPLPDGYPKDFSQEAIDYYDSFDARYLIYSAFSGSWEANYVAMPYCSVFPDDEACAM